MDKLMTTALSSDNINRINNNTIMFCFRWFDRHLYDRIFTNYMYVCLMNSGCNFIFSYISVWKFCTYLKYTIKLLTCLKCTFLNINRTQPYANKIFQLH